jgi:murein DD-endopeptidase MepM/ murein hydrolase activator NlpD
MNEEPEQLPVSRSFHGRLISCNGLDKKGFQEWIFHPGMLLGVHSKWWGKPEKRDRLHEGLDLCAYRTEQGAIHYLNEQTKIPVMFKGRVVNVCDDFLGESMFVRHDACNSNGRRLYTIYGHIKPHHSIQPGNSLDEGDIIGTLTRTGAVDRAIPYHLHISVAWILETLHSENLDWQIMGDPAAVVLLDPLRSIECPYSIESDVSRFTQPGH